MIHHHPSCEPTLTWRAIHHEDAIQIATYLNRPLAWENIDTISDELRQSDLKKNICYSQKICQQNWPSSNLSTYLHPLKHWKRFYKLHNVNIQKIPSSSQNPQPYHEIVNPRNKKQPLTHNLRDDAVRTKRGLQLAAYRCRLPTPPILGTVAIWTDYPFTFL